MKLLAVNGSPRKNKNTAGLLQKIVEGAASKGAESKLVHLRDLKFTGCLSCFECKKVGGRSYGRCAVSDGLTETLAEAAEADVLALGSPLYFGTETAYMRAFMERLCFPSLLYKKENRILSKSKKGTAFIYTMNVPQALAEKMGYDKTIHAAKDRMISLYGSCEVLLACDTKQFDDYSGYESDLFNVKEKLRRHEEEFPLELQLAFELGQNLVS